jgi:hypothetical protein
LFIGKALSIELISLPAKCSHAMQSCDVGRFAVMKKHFRKTLQLILDRGPGLQPHKTQLATLINIAAVKTATRESIKNAFRATGIWPIDETVYSKQLGPSLLLCEAGEGSASGGGELSNAEAESGEGEPESEEDVQVGRGLENFQTPPFPEA